MNLHTHKIALPVIISVFILGCQQSTPIKVESKPVKLALSTPCKKFTVPPIKDTEKLKEMLFKEGKLTEDMSSDEIDLYINQYIKRKNNPPCKKLLKLKSNQTAFVSKEHTHA